MRLNHKILNVALLCLRFCLITASKYGKNLSAIVAKLIPYSPLIGNNVLRRARPGADMKKSGMEMWREVFCQEQTCVVDMPKMVEVK